MHLACFNSISHIRRGTTRVAIAILHQELSRHMKVPRKLMTLPFSLGFWLRMALSHRRTHLGNRSPKRRRLRSGSPFQ
jgi:hypothetical protein